MISLAEICHKFKTNIKLDCSAKKELHNLPLNNTLIVLDEQIYCKYSHLLLRLPILVLDGKAKPNITNVNKIRYYKPDIYVAFGSGSVNDLCKYASFLENKPYIVFPTAASMNGYTSSSASIEFEKFKKSVQAHVPDKIFCDLEIISNAPIRLTRSGIADLLCRSTVQSDWMLAWKMFKIRYNPTPFQHIKPYEDLIIKNHVNLSSPSGASIENIKLLIEALLISGFGMSLENNSNPASQGEHAIAHIMDTITPNNDSLHGEQISVCSLLMSNIQKKILELDSINNIGISKSNLAKCPQFLLEDFTNIYNKKIIKYKTISMIENQWNNIKQDIKAIQMNHNLMHDIFTRCNLPTKPSDLNWDENTVNQVIHYAAFSRERYGFLDLIQNL